MADRSRPLSRLGAWRAVSGVGVLYVALGVGWGAFHAIRGIPLRSVLVLGLLVIAPGSAVAYGSYWLSRTDLDPDLHDGVVRWCLGGIVTMALLVAFSKLQPQNTVTPLGGSLLVLTAIGAAGGLATGVYDSKATMRDGQLDERRRELEETQDRLEETVSRLEESNERLERQSEYTEHVLDGIRDIFYVIDEDGAVRRWNDSLRAVTGYADEPTPDVILLDLSLPRTDGRELLERLHENPDLRAIPVVVFTSSDSRDDVREAYRNSANAYLTKPVDPDTFIETVRTFARFWLETARLPGEE